jgi:ComF family protein
MQGIGLKRLRHPTGLHDLWHRALAADCLACGVHPGNPLCSGCEADFMPATLVRCAVCGARLGARQPAGGEPPGAIDRGGGGVAARSCARCLVQPPQYDATVVLGDYRAPLDAMVLALKAAGRLDLGRALGRMLALRAAPQLARVTLVIPVPLASERLRSRGYNQALELARPVARLSGLTLAPALLQRIRHGVPQQSLGRDRRRDNLRGAFTALPQVAGHAVAVVDDVMTTGATLDAVAGALRAAGTARVVNLVVARTP